MCLMASCQSTGHPAPKVQEMAWMAGQNNARTMERCDVERCSAVGNAMERVGAVFAELQQAFYAAAFRRFKDSRGAIHGLGVNVNALQHWAWQT